MNAFVVKLNPPATAWGLPTYFRRIGSDVSNAIAVECTWQPRTLPALDGVR